MIKCKELLAAGIVRDFRFRNEEAFELYLYSLAHRKIHFRVIETAHASDGTFLVRIVQQYNNTDLIQL